MVVSCFEEASARETGTTAYGVRSRSVCSGSEGFVGYVGLE